MCSEGSRKGMSKQYQMKALAFAFTFVCKRIHTFISRHWHFCMNMPVFIHIIKTQFMRTRLCVSYYREHALGMKIKLINIMVYFQLL